LAHVADIEQPGAGADRHVLVDDPGVLDGHVPAAELHHSRAKRPVRGVQWGLLERSCLGHLCGYQVESYGARSVVALEHGTRSVVALGMNVGRLPHHHSVTSRVRGASISDQRNVTRTT